MSHKEVQGHFSKISAEWNRPTELVDQACADAYNRVANLWGQYADFVPQGFNFQAQNDYFEVNSGETNVYLVREFKDHPLLRIKDVNVPDKFVPFLTRIAEEFQAHEKSLQATKRH